MRSSEVSHFTSPTPSVSLRGILSKTHRFSLAVSSCSISVLPLGWCARKLNHKPLLCAPKSLAIPTGFGPSPRPRSRTATAPHFYLRRSLCLCGCSLIYPSCILLFGVALKLRSLRI